MLYPTQTARESIAVKLGVDAPSLQDQDWEWCVASPELFEDALRLHRAHDTSDLERVCLIEILLQCIAEAIEQDGDHLPRRWPEIEALLTAQPPTAQGRDHVLGRLRAASRIRSARARHRGDTARVLLK